MVNLKMVLSKLIKIPKLVKSQWYQITSSSTLIPVEDITKLFPTLFYNEISLGKLEWRFGSGYL